MYDNHDQQYGPSADEPVATQQQPTQHVEPPLDTAVRHPEQQAGEPAVDVAAAPVAASTDARASDNDKSLGSSEAVVLTARQKRLKAARELIKKLEEEEAAAARKKAERLADQEKKKAERLAPARSRHLARLYEAKGIEEVKGDRGETKRFAKLLEALGIEP